MKKIMIILGITFIGYLASRDDDLSQKVNQFRLVKTTDSTKSTKICFYNND